MEGRKGVIVGQNGLRIEWRRIYLTDRFGALETGNPSSSNQTRIGMDGTVQIVQDGRVRLSAPGRTTMGPFDGWALATRTGYRVAWSGIGDPVPCEAQVPTIRFPNGYQVVFHVYGIHAMMSPPEHGEWHAGEPMRSAGELVLDSVRPRELHSRLQWAERAGAEDWGRGLLLWRNPAPSVPVQ